MSPQLSTKLDEKNERLQRLEEERCKLETALTKAEDKSAVSRSLGYTAGRVRLGPGDVELRGNSEKSPTDGTLS